MPVTLGLRGIARAWSTAACGACAAVVLLQIALVTGVLPFSVQVVPVSLCAVVTLCWAGVVGAAGARTGVLPRAVAQLGRIIGIGVAVALACFVVGFAVTAFGGVSWAWVAGGVPGGVIWFVFPLWTLLLGLLHPDRRDSRAPEPGIRQVWPSTR